MHRKPPYQTKCIFRISVPNRMYLWRTFLSTWTFLFFLPLDDENIEMQHVLFIFKKPNGFLTKYCSHDFCSLLISSIFPLRLLVSTIFSFCNWSERKGAFKFIMQYSAHPYMISMIFISNKKLSSYCRSHFLSFLSYFLFVFLIR